MIIKLKKLDSGAIKPDKAYGKAAGYDLYSAEEVTIESGGYASVGTGWAMELPLGAEAQIRPRSGLAANFGVTVLNSPGTIDPDYRGEVRVILINHGVEAFRVERGMKIAQLVAARLQETELKVTEELGETERGERGFGSSGDGKGR